MNLDQMRDMALIVAAYFAGSVPFAYLVAKAAGGIDIRTVGSGNVGATNVARALGRKWGILVFALDVLKGFVPTAAAWLLLRRPPAEISGGGALLLPVALTGLAAIAGHNWPIFLGFKGGKGVATSCGVFLAIFPLGLLIALGVWAVTVAVTRYISLGSILGAAALLCCALLMQPEPFRGGKYLTAFAALAAVLAILRHRSNIRRLMRGTENKVGRKRD